MKRGTLYIVAAPSGAGKSSIVNAVLARDAEIALSISFTSRGARPGERHAQHYHFISAEEFEAMIRAGDFFEYARVHGDWKGTARQSVEPQLAAGKDVLLEIDWQGARQVREKVPDAVSVFILPPSRQALEQRMRARGQDSEEVIQRRLAAAREEMSHPTNVAPGRSAAMGSRLAPSLQPTSSTRSSGRSLALAAMACSLACCAASSPCPGCSNSAAE